MVIVKFKGDGLDILQIYSQMKNRASMDTFIYPTCLLLFTTLKVAQSDIICFALRPKKFPLETNSFCHV